MVVFQNDDSTPQTYLNRLKKFVNTYYSQSQIQQSHPTIQLELNHITFELVPALREWLNYKIPSRNDGIDEWIDTDPNRFNEELTKKNQNNNQLIKPLVRLLKYWNAKHDYVFESFRLEKDIVAKHYFSDAYNKKLKNYFYNYVEFIEVDGSIAQSKQDKIIKLQERVAEAQSEESEGNYDAAEKIIRKIFER